MRTQTFSGATSREVLQKVKQALGDDALILSNRACGGGIEVVALAASDATPAAPAPAPGHVTPAAPAPRAPVAVPVQFAPAQWAGAPAEPSQLPPGAPAALAQAGGSIEGILSEIQSLKSMIQNDMASIAAVERQPVSLATCPILRDLLNAGFSPQLARRLADPSPAGVSVTMPLVAERLAAELKLAEADEIINRGGIYALVGPTGVGKTTTVAKLAARCVVRFGASKVALLTTDGYRIGAHDQLRIYGRILSVPVHAIRDSNDLATMLAELSGRHLILIDTIGMSQRDRMVAEQAAMLAGGGDVKRVLLVQTTANTATLNQVVSAYKHAGVDGCILTKTDEAASLAPALDAMIRHGLPVHYVTDGQRVPEDLQLPDAAALVREALQPTDGAFDLLPDEVAMVMQPKPAVPAIVAVPRTTDWPAAAGGMSELPKMPLAHAIHSVRHQVEARVVHG